jgi:hypothetical protein
VILNEQSTAYSFVMTPKNSTRTGRLIGITNLNRSTVLAASENVMVIND